MSKAGDALLYIFVIFVVGRGIAEGVDWLAILVRVYHAPVLRAYLRYAALALLCYAALLCCWSLWRALRAAWVR